MANDDTITSETGNRGSSQSRGKQNNPGNFANDRDKASRAGKKGAKAQPLEAKRRGGENSHRNS